MCHCVGISPKSLYRQCYSKGNRLREGYAKTQLVPWCRNDYQRDILLLSVHHSFQWVNCYTEKTILPIPFTLNGIWSWWQLSFRFWTKWNFVWFKIERIISYSMWKDMDIYFSQCMKQTSNRNLRRKMLHVWYSRGKTKELIAPRIHATKPNNQRPDSLLLFLFMTNYSANPDWNFWKIWN